MKLGDWKGELQCGLPFSMESGEHTTHPKLILFQRRAKMKIGDLVFSNTIKEYGIIVFIDDKDPACVGVLYAGDCDWCFGCSEDLEAICK